MQSKYPTTLQQPPVLANCSTQQGMSMMVTLLEELRGPLVGAIQMALILVFSTSTVMVLNIDWLILILDQSSMIAMSTMSGQGKQHQVNCYSYSQQQHQWLPSHCTTTVTVSEAFPD